MWRPATLTVVSSVQFLMESSPLKTTMSVETGAISPDQLAAQDHLFPSPAAPPQVPSVPPPSQVLAAVAAANVQPVLLIRLVQAVQVRVAGVAPLAMLLTSRSIKVNVPLPCQVRWVGGAEELRTISSRSSCPVPPPWVSIVTTPELSSVPPKVKSPPPRFFKVPLAPIVSAPVASV